MLWLRRQQRDRSRLPDRQSLQPIADALRSEFVAAFLPRLELTVLKQTAQQRLLERVATPIATLPLTDT